MSSKGRSQGVNQGATIQTPDEKRLFEQETDWMKQYTGQGAPDKTDPYNAKVLDQWYWDEIEQYKNNPEWYKILSNNPYLVSNSGGFEPDIFQKIMESFGDTSARNKYTNNLQAQARKWLTDQLGALHGENYENPINQASLNRQAGLNPDLIGIQGSEAGNASDEASPAMLPDTGFDQAQRTVTSVTQGVLSFMTNTLALVKQVKEYQNMDTSVTASELGNFKDTREFLMEAIASRMNPDHFQGKFANPDDLTDEFYDSNAQFSTDLRQAIEDVLSSADYNKFNKRTRRTLRFIANNIDTSNPLKIKVVYEELYNKYLKARKENAEIVADEEYSEDFKKMVEGFRPRVKAYIQGSIDDAEIKSYEKALKAGEKGIQDYRLKKIRSLDTLFNEIGGYIPSDKWWSPFAKMALDLSKMQVIQTLFGE